MQSTGARWARGAARLGLTLGLGLGLGACTVGSRDTLGLTAPPPDEFLVVARQPLERPADMAALPLPRPGAPSRVEPDPEALARGALSGAPAVTQQAGSTAETGLSAAERTLVAGAGGRDADPAIRQTLAEERFVPQRRFGLDSLFGIPIVQDPADAARRVQPAAEAERLREAGLPAPTSPPAPPEGGATTP